MATHSRKGNEKESVFRKERERGAGEKNDSK